MDSFKVARRWFLWHKWTSLICTLFLLLLCVTGLPLVFHHEIEALTENNSEEIRTNGPDLNLDRITEIVKSQEPAKVIRFLYWDHDEPNAVFASLSDSLKASPNNYKIISLNRVTGNVHETATESEGFMYTMLRLHVDLFAGVPGKLFMAFMGVLFVIAIISGFMLYGPIMKKFDFGMIRTDKSRKLKWLDMHNMLGIVTLTWAMVVGLTGVINGFADVVLSLWQQGQLAEMTAPYKNSPPFSKDQILFSLDESSKTAKKAAPGMGIALIAFPGTVFTSNHHYAVFMKGNSPLTSRILKPALIDAQNGKLTDIRSMPWYVNTVFIAQPLHFGDYGGLPLKIIWSLLDLATIVVLVSGLILWVVKMKASKVHFKRLALIQETKIVVKKNE